MHSHEDLMKNLAEKEFYIMSIKIQSFVYFECPILFSKEKSSSLCQVVGTAYQTLEIINFILSKAKHVV